MTIRGGSQDLKMISSDDPDSYRAIYGPGPAYGKGSPLVIIPGALVEK